MYYLTVETALYTIEDLIYWLSSSQIPDL